MISRGALAIDPPAELIVNTVHALVVQLTDAGGQPQAIAGMPLRFDLDTVPEPRRPDSLPASLCGTTPAPPACAEQSAIALTDAMGRATMHLTVGHTSGELIVQAYDMREDPSSAAAMAIVAQPDRDSARLIEVGGNNQTGEQGEEVADSLVARLEDQFGNPIPDEPVQADADGAVTFTDAGMAPRPSKGVAGMTRGTSGLVTRTELTDRRGEMRFRLRILEEAADRDIRVQVSVPGLPEVEPLQYLVIVGAIDTPDVPLDLAVSRRDASNEVFVFVADRFSGMQVIDASEPTNPVRLHEANPLALTGTALRLALAEDFAYVGTFTPTRLYVVDVRDPRNPNFPTDGDGDGRPDVVLGQVDLLNDAEGAQNLVGGGLA